MNSILEYLEIEQNIVEELIKIDNDVMNTKYSYIDYYNAFDTRFSSDVIQMDLNYDTVFVTEGDVLLTLDILRRFNTDKHVIIFINQNNIAMNKWLISKYNEITGNTNIELDLDINYNKYIDEGYKVIPLGEDGLVDQVMEDFYDKG